MFEAVRANSNVLSAFYFFDFLLPFAVQSDWSDNRLPNSGRKVDKFIEPMVASLGKRFGGEVDGSVSLALGLKAV